MARRGDPGVTLPSAPDWGRRQAGRPRGAGCGALFQTRLALLPSPLPSADAPGAAGWRASGATPPGGRARSLAPDFANSPGTRCPRCARRSRQVLLGHRSSGWQPRGSGIYPGTCRRLRRKADRPRPRKGWAGCGPLVPRGSRSFLFSPGGQIEKLERRSRRPGARARRREFKHKEHPRKFKIPRARLLPGLLNQDF